MGAPMGRRRRASVSPIPRSLAIRNKAMALARRGHRARETLACRRGFGIIGVNPGRHRAHVRADGLPGCFPPTHRPLFQWWQVTLIRCAPPVCSIHPRPGSALTGCAPR